jgi:cytochrome P450
MTDTANDLYYDPFDIEIDKDPHPLWRRMRDEMPLYYNDRHDFFAVSRFDDVERAMVDWDTYRSGRGSTLEIIKANIQLPPGIILMEDPPIHDLHRGLLSRVFTPWKMNAIEPKVREFCARSLDPLVGSGGFDFITDLGALMPMRTIGILLGIPEQDQVAIRDAFDAGMRIEEGEAFMPSVDHEFAGMEMFAVRRADHHPTGPGAVLLRRGEASYVRRSRRGHRDEPVEGPGRCLAPEAAQRCCDTTERPRCRGVEGQRLERGLGRVWLGQVVLQRAASGMAAR